MKRTDPKQPVVWLILVAALIAWALVLGVAWLLLK
jgi:hypothetical protein